MPSLQVGFMLDDKQYIYNLIFVYIHVYMDYAGLEIYVNSRIAWLFSGQIAIGNAGPTSALKYKGPKPTFRSHFLNIGPRYKQ